MQFATIHLGGQDYTVRGPIPEVVAALKTLLAKLTLVNIAYFRDHPEAPALYSSGVRYQREVDGAEVWQTYADLLKTKRGDCEDLACVRAAELRVRHGEPNAKAFPRGRDMGDHVLFHILVRRQDGSVEDPSRKLGM